MFLTLAIEQEMFYTISVEIAFKNILQSKLMLQIRV